MLYQLELSPGTCFATTSSALGLSKAQADKIQEQRLTPDQVQFFYDTMERASARLMHCELQGSC